MDISRDKSAGLYTSKPEHSYETEILREKLNLF